MKIRYIFFLFFAVKPKVIQTSAHCSMTVQKQKFSSEETHTHTHTWTEIEDRERERFLFSVQYGMRKSIALNRRKRWTDGYMHDE